MKRSIKQCEQIPRTESNQDCISYLVTLLLITTMRMNVTLFSADLNIAGVRCIPILEQVFVLVGCDVTVVL